MVKQLKIKNISLNIPTISSQVLAKNYQKKIPPTKKHFSSFLKNPNNLSFFITPTNVKQTNDLISDLKASKSTRPSSLPTKVMNQLNNIMASPLVELVNKKISKHDLSRYFQNC